MNAIITAFCLALSVAEIFSDIDYYWRDYTGEIPLDAFPGGKDQSGKDFYIGQAIVHRYCVSVVKIVRGRKEVYAPCLGVKQINNYIKILCTKDPEKFEWISTTARTFHEDTAGKHPIQGGYDFQDGKGQVHIGRVNYEGDAKIGCTASFVFENVRLFFPVNGDERSAGFYQVLVYRDGSTNETSQTGTCTSSVT